MRPDAFLSPRSSIGSKDEPAAFCGKSSPLSGRDGQHFGAAATSRPRLAPSRRTRSEAIAKRRRAVECCGPISTATRSQAVALNGMLGAFCELYNAGLQQRLEAYQRQRKSLRYLDQANELKAVRLADDRLAGYSYSPEQQILRRLDKAFAAFFCRLKTKGKAGFPRFRAKSRFDSAEFRVGDGLTIRNNGRLGIVGVPAEIKVKWHRPLPTDAKLGAAVISRSCGKWFVCFQIELPDADAVVQAFAPVGIDMGLTSLVALSTGEMVATPQYVSKAAKRLRRLQPAVARRRRHSERQRKARL